MVLGVGLVSAVIVSKKNPNYKTRLDKLQLKLRENRLTRTTLYQIPTKRIITILIIVLIIFIFQHFQESLRLQLLEVAPSAISLAIQQSPLGTIKNQTLSSPFEIYEENQAYQNLSTVLMWIKIAHFCMIVGVIADLRWKVVEIVPECIKITEYNRENWGKRTSIKWDKDNCRVQIVARGQQKMNHYTSHYALEVMNKSEKSAHQIIKRSHIFQARKTIIELGSILQFKPDLHIH